MKPNKLILINLLLASPMLAQVQWSNPGTAINSLLVNSTGGRICRVISGGDSRVGTAANGICSYAVGNTIQTSTTFEVAAGLGKWEAPNLNGAVEVGNIGFVPTRVCRPTLHNAELAAGFTSGTPAVCNLPTSNGVATTPHFEVLYNFETSGEFHVLQRGLCLSTRSGAGPAVAFKPCGFTGSDQWRFQTAAGGYKLESVANPGSCLAQGVLIPFPLIEGALIRPCASAPVLNLENYSPQNVRIRDTAANIVLGRRDNGFSAHILATFRAQQNLNNEVFEIQTINEASRRLSVLAYNVYLLPDDQFPSLRQDDRAEWISDALNRTGLLADVIAFQEGFQTSARNKLVSKLLADHGYLFFTGVPDWPQSVYDSEYLNPLLYITFGQFRLYTNGGAFISSRWPMEKIRYHRFSNKSDDGPFDTTGLDAFAAKGVAYARINKLGRRYHVFSTHLQAGDSSDEGPVRRAQLQEMRVFADNMLAGAPPEDGVIFAGDFNINMETEVSDYNHMMDTLMARFFDATRPAGTSNSTHNPRWTVEPAQNAIKTFTEGSNQWLDYVFSSGRNAAVDHARYQVWQVKHNEQFDMKTAVLGFGPTLRAQDLSDHGALFARLRFSPTSNLVQPAQTVNLAFQTRANGNNILNGAVSVNGGAISTPALVEVEKDVPLEISAYNYLSGATGIRYKFDRWADGGANPLTYTPTSNDEKIAAEYQRELEVTTSASPAGAGTVSGAGYYSENASVSIGATAAPGFRFTRFTGARNTTQNPFSMPVRDPLQIVAEFESTGAPRLNALTHGSRSDTQNGLRRVFFKLNNSGSGGATNARISGLVGASVLSGNGAVSLPAGSIANFGAIAAGAQSPEASLDFVWPATATRVRLVLLIEADGGYSTTATLTLFR